MTAMFGRNRRGCLMAANTIRLLTKLPMKLREDLVPQQLHVVFVRELVDLGKAPLRCRHSLIERNQLLAADALDKMSSHSRAAGQ